MMNEKDFQERDLIESESDVYTDLAIERRRAETDIPGIDYRRERTAGGVWERISITSNEGAKSIGRPMGCYDTLNTRRIDTLDPDDIDDAKEEIARELCLLCDREDIRPGRILVVGLGNKSLTPDALGALTAEKIIPTLGLGRRERRMFEALECSEIAVIAPGVEGTSGIETRAFVHGICKEVRPDLVIAVDALASRSEERLGSTVQMASTGIIAGSGLGDHKSSINRETLGVPVISVGIPTVINSRVIRGSTAPKTEGRSEMFVSPKEIDGIVRAGAEIIGGGINQAFGIMY